MWRLSYFIPIWIFVISLRLVFILAGLVLIPLAVLLKAYENRESKIFKGKIIPAWKWKFMYPWGNEEDGIVAGLEYLDKPEWFRIIYWSARRNPANNLRFMPFFSCKIDKEKVDYILRKTVQVFPPPITKEYLEQAEEVPPLTYLCWQGIWYSNFRKEFKLKFKHPWVNVSFGKYFVSVKISIEQHDAYWRFWIGNTKVYPSDIFGVSPTSYRIHGAGPVTQFKKLK